MNHRHFRNAAIAGVLLAGGALLLLFGVQLWPAMPEVVGKAIAAGILAAALTAIVELGRWLTSPWATSAAQPKERSQLLAAIGNGRLSPQTREEAQRRLDQLSR